jgi:uncharacterized membrane protein YuzA (DUF378 family)
MNYNKSLSSASFWLVILGALVMGVYGLTGVDVIEYLFGDTLSIVAYTLDILIGIAAVYQIVIYFSSAKK